MKRIILFLTVLLSLVAECLAENTDSLRIADVRAQMDSLCIKEPAFCQSVDISVGQMRLTELLRTVAQMKKVNLSVRDDFDCIVSCTFAQSRIDDLIVFLCREYGLGIEVYGNIVSIFRHVAPMEPEQPVVIDYSVADSLLNFSFHDKSLAEVTEIMMKKTGENIIIPRELRTMNVSSSGIRINLSDALEIIAGGNGLEVFKVQGQKNIWCFAKKVENNGSQPRRHREAQLDIMDTTLIVPLHYRAVSNILELVPDEMKKNVTLLTSDEMNALVIHGRKDLAASVQELVSRFDVTIPLVSIDVMIVETTKRFSKNVGLKAGKNATSVETSAAIGQGMELVLGSSEVSSLLQRMEGFSNVNLGNVAENLYLELKLLENRGDVKLESTPKLATLNGHKASMSKGETMYYKEINTSYLGSQNPLQTSSYNWKSVDADLTIDITPHVSLDSLITLEVDLSQSEFGTIKEENAPPPITKRSFKSIVRVGAGDVVLLGGLDSALDSDSRDGLPWIARVPVLRWIFGSHRREKSDSRMSIFIRAVIVD